MSLRRYGDPERVEWARDVDQRYRKKDGNVKGIVDGDSVFIITASGHNTRLQILVTPVSKFGGNAD